MTFFELRNGQKLREIRDNDKLISIIDIGDGFFVNHNKTSLCVFSVDNAEFVGEVFKSNLSQSTESYWHFEKLSDGQYAFEIDEEIKILDFKALL